MTDNSRPFDEKYDAVVIGAGIGGLACAVKLAENGLVVKVFEHHSMPGGYCTSFSRERFHFSSAVVFVSGCGPEGEMTKVLAELGVKDRIQFTKIEPLCQVLLPGKSLVIPATLDEWGETLRRDFPKEPSGIGKFIGTVRAIAADMKKLPVKSDLINKYQSRTLADLISEFLTDPYLKAAVASLFYGGLPPSRFSALSWCAAMDDRMKHGVYWPVGGGQVIADALADKLKENGGSLGLGTGVRRIILDGSKAIGVETTDTRRIKAGFVISNAAAYQTFGGLISRQELDRVAPETINKLNTLEMAMPMMSIYLGTDLDIKAAGRYLTIVHESLDFEGEWQAAAQGNLEDAFFSVSVPTLIDPKLAPANKHIVHILTCAPYYLPGRDWSQEEKTRLTDILIKKAERVIPHLSKHILVCEAATPRTNERYTLNTEGSTGWTRVPSNLFTRPRPKTAIEGLFLTGQWTNGGASVRGVAINGCAVARMILGERK